MFGSITCIFFILIQIRVYKAYANNIQYDTKSALNYCQISLMRGALVLIILTYISFLLFIGIYVFVIINAHRKRQEKRYKEFEMKTHVENTRF
jgi:hypothetical protein